MIISRDLQYYLKEQKEQEKDFMKFKKKDKDGNFNRRPLPHPTDTGTFAIIVFNSQEAKDCFETDSKLVDKIRNFFCNCCEDLGMHRIQGQPVSVKRAPEPDDILWENAHNRRPTIIRNRVIAHLCCLVILVAGGVGQYYLYYASNFVTDDDAQTLLSLGTSILINVTNFIIVQVLIVVTRLEGNATRTEQNESLLVKICLYEFFNAGIFYSGAKILAQSVNNFNIQGTISFEIMLFMVINALSPTLINLALVVFEFPESLKRCCLKNGWSDSNQKEANELYEFSKISFPEKYSYVIKTIWLSLFYGPFVPIVVPISIVGLFLFYFTEVYLFRTHYNVPRMLSKHIANTAQRLLNYIVLVIAAGQTLMIIYIAYTLDSGLTTIEIVSIVLGVALAIVFLFIPGADINKRLFKFDDTENPLSYADAEEDFEVTYEGTNPLSPPSARSRKQ